ncbi:NAD(P)/FAD-dependent oxidoreductase [Kamptonema sp. UHCC 0994]|uniref:dihydrolipoyl dehydrogenase family protein n=1 Tax=Kamptonema sp. UHCC 0994 TaxID=3031329 RepID=UPI0023BA0D4F|nr:NAD(P)/FAD-dependent oxidoreductase [Kamptonema sp. UHCC 0994]MDF0554133.1 NAD(P)/FAD-dependent oxidoreductase [Kamptonema sp. UHCC 0994]
MLDYDVVIIGGTAAGRFAALTATHLKARVALVESPNNWQELSLSGKHSSVAGLRYSQSLLEMGRFVQQMRFSQQFNVPIEDKYGAEIALQFDIAKLWISGVASNLNEIHSPDVLAAAGVDIIVGKGEFIVKPDLGFAVDGRILRSRSFLLATPSQPAIPEIEGLLSTGYFTAESRQLSELKKLPDTLVVIGGDPAGVELAQAFARLGVRVTMVVKSSHILAKEDTEAALLVQATMEAEGVRILTQTEVTQARIIDGKKWIQAGNEAIEADEILVAAGCQMPNFESLNLLATGVTFNKKGLILNNKLQTTNSRIYACTDVAGGYPFANIANYEAKIALKNALFLPIFKVDYRGIPWAIFSDPQLARVGMTEAQAITRYGDDIIVCREYFKTIDKAQMGGETTGFCKLIGSRSGEILGASLVGPQAAELIHSIALAMRQGLKMDAIAELPHIWPTLSEINGKTAASWQLQRFRSQPFLSNLLENLFHWRRYWNW